MTGDSWPNEVSWELACDGLAPIRGGVLYSETHTVPQGSCTLRLMDSYGDGWQGATWTAPGWTDLSLTVPHGREHIVSFYIGQVPPSPPSPPLRCGETTPDKWVGYAGRTCGGCAALVKVRDNGGTC